MQQIIQEKIREIEKQEQVKIIYAVESGSRAWGFASPDSDYDVRFIYVRQPDFYLKLEKTRDVIEWQLDETLDINGWDLQKALRLLKASNPTLFEWANSPIVYGYTEAWNVLKPVLNHYFSPRAGFHHYLNTAISNYRSYLKGEMVHLKKYFYVIRPLLACKWILDKNSPPPVLFHALAEAELEPELKPVIDELLDMKINSPEVKLCPRIDILNQYIDRNLKELPDNIHSLSREIPADYIELNQMFLSIINSIEQTS